MHGPESPPVRDNPVLVRLLKMEREAAGVEVVVAQEAESGGRKRRRRGTAARNVLPKNCTQLWGRGLVWRLKLRLQRQSGMGELRATIFSCFYINWFTHVHTLSPHREVARVHPEGGERHVQGLGEPKESVICVTGRGGGGEMGAAPSGLAKAVHVADK